MSAQENLVITALDSRTLEGNKSTVANSPVHSLTPSVGIFPLPGGWSALGVSYDCAANSRSQMSIFFIPGVRDESLPTVRLHIF
jgi:hypothetical protein